MSFPEFGPDAKWQALLEEMQEAQNRDVTRLAEASEPILEELKAVGVVLGSLGELYRLCPLEKQVVQVLLGWLRPTLNHEILDGILTNLRRPKKKGFDGRALARLFEQTSSRDIRFAIGDTINFAEPAAINEWIKGAISDPTFGDARLALAPGAAKLLPPEEANPVLISLFDMHPYAISEALGISGGAEEIAFLESKAKQAKGTTKKDIQRAINKIKKRLKVL